MIVITCSRRTLIDAAKKGDLKSVEMHLRSRFFKKAWLSPEGKFSPLYAAACNGHKDVAEKLIIAGSDLNAFNGDGPWTALEAVSDLGWTELVKLLLQYGANPNLSESSSYPLHRAVARGNLEIIKALVDSQALVDVGDRAGNTPLHITATRNKIDIAEHLLKSRAKTDILNRQGKTALALAKEKHFEFMVKLLEGDIKVQTQEPVALPPAPANAPAVAAAETWVQMGAGKMAHIETFPDMQCKLTEIFNFESRVVQAIKENLQTRAETALPNVEFSSLSPETLKGLFDRFTAAGGKADEDFILNGPPHQPCPCRSRKIGF